MTAITSSINRSPRRAYFCQPTPLSLHHQEAEDGVSQMHNQTRQGGKHKPNRNCKKTMIDPAPAFRCVSREEASRIGDRLHRQLPKRFDSPEPIRPVSIWRRSPQSTSRGAAHPQSRNQRPVRDTHDFETFTSKVRGITKEGKQLLDEVYKIKGELKAGKLEQTERQSKELKLKSLQEELKNKRKKIGLHDPLDRIGRHRYVNAVAQEQRDQYQNTSFRSSPMPVKWCVRLNHPDHPKPVQVPPGTCSSSLRRPPSCRSSRPQSVHIHLLRRKQDSP